MSSSLRPHPPLVRTESFPADLSLLHEMLAFILSEAQRSLSQPLANRLEVACEEILVNIISHGYQGIPGTIQLTISADAKQVEVAISDSAPLFNPLQIEPQATPPEERIGGYGLRIVRKIVDDASYSQQEGKNLFRLVMRRPASL